MLVNTPAAMNKDLTKCGQVCRAFCKTGGDEMQKVCAIHTLLQTRGDILETILT